jgi:hypothetical protein
MSETTAVISKTLRNARSVSNVIGDSLAQIRSQIDDLKVARDEIEVLPVSVEVAVDRAEKWAEWQVAKARQAAPTPSHFCQSQKRWDGAYQPFCDPGASVLAYMGEAFIESVKKQVKAAYGGDQGMAEKQRLDLLAKNDAEILAAELAEEAIVRHAEKQGFKIDRRSDADPRAVLAYESALP